MVPTSMIATPMSTLPMNVSTKRKREDDNYYDHEDRVYTCKTCNKGFSSFQALGGHRAGHNNRIKNDADVASGDVEKRLHMCFYCFEKFVSGQALGGHMRKHRGIMEGKVKPFSSKKNKRSESFKEDERLRLSDCDPDLVLRIEPIRSMFVEEKEKPGSPSSEVLDLESFKENKALQLVDSGFVRESNNFLKEELRCGCSLKVVFMEFLSEKSDQVEKVPVENVPVLEDDDSWLELRLGL